MYSNLDSMLLKANLDKETKSLIGSSPIAIANSLRKHMNNANIIEYRSLIQKADEEANKEEEAFRAQIGGRGSDRYGVGELAQGSDEVSDYGSIKEEDTVTVDFQSKNDYRDFKRVYYQYKFLLNNIGYLQQLAQDIKIKKSKGTPSGYEFEGQEVYLQRFGRDKNNPRNSNTIFNVLYGINNPDSKVPLLRRSTFIKEIDGKLILEALVPPKKGEQDYSDEGNKLPDLDLTQLESKFKSLASKQYPIGETDETISFVEVFKNLHINRYSAFPFQVTDKKKYAREISNMIADLERGVQETETQKFEASLKRIKGVIARTTQLANKITVANVIIEILGAMSKDSLDYLKTELEDYLSRLNLSTEDKREIKSTVLSRERKEVLQVEIEAERAKMNALKEELTQVNEHLDVFVEFMSYIKRYNNFEDLSPLKKKTKQILDSYTELIESILREAKGEDYEKRGAKRILELKDKITVNQAILPSLEKYDKLYADVRKDIRQLASKLARLDKNLKSIESLLAKEKTLGVIQYASDRKIETYPKVETTELRMKLSKDLIDAFRRSIQTMIRVNQESMLDDVGRQIRESKLSTMREQIKGFDAVSDDNMKSALSAFDKLDADVDFIAQKLGGLEKKLLDLGSAYDEYSALIDVDEGEEEQ